MINSIEPYVTLFQVRYNQDISVYDETFLQNTINGRRAELGIETNLEYLNYLENVPAEPTRLLSQLSNSYSEFFRNSLTFSILEQAVLPRIFDSKEKNHSLEIRIWSAGCASGQEPYSLAMLFDDFKSTRSSSVTYRIFATDSSVDELALARKGIFDLKSVKNTKLQFAEKYFKRKGEFYQLHNRLKEQVDFSQYDLLEKDSSSPPSSIYGDFDLIMCCNVLFYYHPEYQQMILKKIHRSLKQDGFFITGEAETQIANSFGGFSQYASPAAIFQKKQNR